MIMFCKSIVHSDTKVQKLMYSLTECHGCTYNGLALPLHQLKFAMYLCTQSHLLAEQKFVIGNRIAKFISYYVKIILTMLIEKMCSIVLNGDRVLALHSLGTL